MTMRRETLMIFDPTTRTLHGADDLPAAPNGKTVQVTLPEVTLRGPFSRYGIILDEDDAGGGSIGIGLHVPDLECEAILRLSVVGRRIQIEVYGNAADRSYATATILIDPPEVE
jgi:hypothetical protein